MFQPVALEVLLELDFLLQLTELTTKTIDSNNLMPKILFVFILLVGNDLVTQYNNKQLKLLFNFYNLTLTFI